MPKKMTPEDAANFLRNIEDEHAFYVNNGPVIRNISELPEVMKNMSDEQFQHHVNSERNDFTNWIKDIVGDAQLARDLAKVKSKATAIKKVKSRLQSLKKTANNK